MEGESIKYEDFVFPDWNNQMPVMSKNKKVLNANSTDGVPGLAVAGSAYITQDQHFPAGRQVLFQLHTG